MRFKAELATEQLRLLYSLIGPISRLSPKAICYLDPEYLRLSTRDSDGISCFSELRTATTANNNNNNSNSSTNGGGGGGIFLQHRIESLAGNNEIVFEIDLVQWRTAMQSIVGDITTATAEYYHHQDDGGGGGTVVGRGDGFNNHMIAHPPNVGYGGITVMKLAKRGGVPCLCLDGKCAGAVDVYHAIPVRVMRAEDIKYHLPPQIQKPDVQLEMTNEKPLRIVVERLKAISPHVYIEGNMAGELTLRMDNDGSSIRTFFSNLIPRFEDTKLAQEDEGDSQNHHPTTTMTSRTTPTTILKVDTKKLSTCLQWQVGMRGNVSSALLCMVENEMLVIHVMLNPISVGFFTFYCPVHFLSSSSST